MTTAKRRKLPVGIRELSSGKYQARYSVTTMVDGKKVTQQLTAGTFTSLADAKDARSVQLAKLKTGSWINPLGPRTPFADWADQWVELKMNIAPNTASFLRHRIVPYWGTRRLGDIGPLDVQTWVNSLVADGLAPGSVRAIYSCFKQILAKAVDCDLLVKTPCRTITLPSVGKTEIVRLSASDLAYLEQMAPPRLKAMIHLGAWAGLRWQECAALRWENVDLDTGVLHICEAVKRDGTIGTTKNGKDRYVAVAPATVATLRRHRHNYSTQGLLFLTPRSRTHLDYPSFMTRVWRPLIQKCGIAPTGFHALRHAHAGHMIAQGMDWKVLSERLGHHAPSFTADRYGWARADHDVVSVKAIEAAMLGEYEDDEDESGR